MIFTIGFSERPIGEFVALLRQVAVDRVIDVRANPRSQTNPQFSAEVLPRSLAAAGITYSYLPQLAGPCGGSGGRQAHNRFWQSPLLDGYADYAETALFRKGLAELRAIALEHYCAIMCLDILWHRCFQSIIIDHLLAEGVTVAHIFGSNNIELASLTPGALVRPDGRLVYPAAGWDSSQ